RLRAADVGSIDFGARDEFHLSLQRHQVLEGASRRDGDQCRGVAHHWRLARSYSSLWPRSAPSRLDTAWDGLRPPKRFATWDRPLPPMAAVFHKVRAQSQLAGNYSLPGVHDVTDRKAMERSDRGLWVGWGRSELHGR